MLFFQSTIHPAQNRILGSLALLDSCCVGCVGCIVISLRCEIIGGSDARASAGIPDRSP